MRPTGAMDALRARQLPQNRQKFGLRTMKSLRQIGFWSSVALTLLSGSYLVAHAAQQSTAQPSSQPARPESGTQQTGTPNQPPMTDAQARITVNSRLVVLPVTVKSRDGEMIPDLERGDFRIFEDNVEQNIDVFTAEAFPLSMVILIDNDLKDKDAEKVQASLQAILGGMSEYDEAFVCRFDQFFHSGKGFTSNQDELAKELKRTNLDSEPSVGTPGGPFTRSPSINGHSAVDQSTIDGSTQIIKGQPTKALDDAVYEASTLLHDRPRSRRRVILLISDGVNGGKKFNKFAYEDVIKILLRDNITVYSVAAPSAYLERKISPIDRTVNPLIRYANDSGGEIYRTTKEEGLETFYARLTEEARHQYTLAYIPRGTNPASEYHSIEVRVKREKVDVRTREGYYSGQLPTAR
jgi:Ca-activated chloride channel homolog